MARTCAPAALFLAAAALACAGAGAQTIYKCTHNGQTSYGDRPCAVGLSSKMAAPDTPGKVDDSVMRRQQRALAQIEKEHARDDAATARIERAAAVQRKKCADLTLQQKWLAEDAVKAGPKEQDKAQQKVRRGAEKLASACRE